jgi:hypothetical protein
MGWGAFAAAFRLRQQRIRLDTLIRPIHGV